MIPCFTKGGSRVYRNDIQPKTIADLGIDVSRLRLIYIGTQTPWHDDQEEMPAPDFARDVIRGFLGEEPLRKIYIRHPDTSKQMGHGASVYPHSIFQEIDIKAPTSTQIRIEATVQILHGKYDDTDWEGVQLGTVDRSKLSKCTLSHGDFLYIFMKQYGQEMMSIVSKHNPALLHRINAIVQCSWKFRNFHNKLEEDITSPTYA